MTHEDHRPALLGDVAHFPQTLSLKCRVAYGQNFVHQQDLRLQVRGHGEGQAQVHAARVMLHRRVDKLLHLGESTISSNCRTISARRIPRIAPFRKMFSRPVSSG